MVLNYEEYHPAHPAAEISRRKHSPLELVALQPFTFFTFSLNEGKHRRYFPGSCRPRWIQLLVTLLDHLLAVFFLHMLRSLSSEYLHSFKRVKPEKQKGVREVRCFASKMMDGFAHVH